MKSPASSDRCSEIPTVYSSRNGHPEVTRKSIPVYTCHSTMADMTASTPVPAAGASSEPGTTGPGAAGAAEPDSSTTSVPPSVSPASVAVDDDGQDGISDEALLSVPLPDDAAAATVTAAPLPAVAQPNGEASAAAPPPPPPQMEEEEEEAAQEEEDAGPGSTVVSACPSSPLPCSNHHGTGGAPASAGVKPTVPGAPMPPLVWPSFVHARHRCLPAHHSPSAC